MSGNVLPVRSCGPMDAPEVVFLHGFMGSARDWDEVVALLRGAYRCHALDLPGHGAARAVRMDARAYTMEATARNVLCTLDQLGLSNAILVGYSMGGRLALRLALDVPQRWRCVVVESGSPGLIQEREREARARVDEVWARRFESEPLERVVEAWYNQPLFATLKRDVVRYKRMLQRRCENDPLALAACMRGMSVARMQPMWDELATARVKLVMAVGGLDTKYKRVAARMVDIYPAARIVEIEDAGHNAHEECPDLFAALIKKELQR